MRRVHITGGPGAGKTRLARRLSQRVGLPHIDTDLISLELQADLPLPLDFDLLMAHRLPLSERLASEDAWISEGSNLVASRPFYERADLVVYMRCEWRVAAYRILMRHARASLAGNNRFPGLGNLRRFFLWSRRYYANRNAHGVNGFGTPATIAYHEEALQAYGDKLVVCRTKADVAALEQRLLRELSSKARRR